MGYAEEGLTVSIKQDALLKGPTVNLIESDGILTDDRFAISNQNVTDF
ncbi:hypothetical protein [Cytobacillus firmus]|nr:hypothetical protein [Cytobacillus firmus]